MSNSSLAYFKFAVSVFFLEFLVNLQMDLSDLIKVTTVLGAIDPVRQSFHFLEELL